MIDSAKKERIKRDWKTSTFPGKRKLIIEALEL